MTEDLRTMLRERAGAARLAPVDAAKIAHAGASRLRRRRWAAVAGSVATVMTVAGLATLTDRDPDRDQPLTPPPSPSVTPISWVTGSTLHAVVGLDGSWSGTSTQSIGRQITSYVRTSLGYVLSDGKEVYSLVDGPVQPVGTIAPARTPGGAELLGDTDGALAAWTDGSSYVVLDQGTGDVQRFAAVGAGALVAVDARTLYISDDRGAIAIDVDSGTETRVAKRGDQPYPVSWEDGRAVRRAQDGLIWIDGTGGHAPRRVGARPITLADALATSVQLSPDARFLTYDTTVTASVLDTSTGRQVPLPLGEGETMGYEWLDADTLAVLQLPTAHGHYRLLSCTVSTLECAVAVPDLGEGKDDGGNGVRFVLPIGEAYYPYPHG